ncbi:MAG: class I SAM-dependent methyltransferase, partial [Proteobacteria bacterium]|nr:class I SAM-dependent methyltransferase [Pseudomonadota bacterium]
GDMTGEYDFFAHTAEVTSIDAYDISPGQRKKFFNRLDIDPDIEVNYQIADVNQISLPASTYDVVYIQQAFHHLEAIEHVAKEIHNALKPHGIFVLIDYIGPNQLQRSEKQRRICGEIWSGLPERLRTTAQGLVYDQIHIPKIEALPPFEAVRAEEIMGVLTDTFDVDSLFTYAGILFPLLEGFAQNYTESEEDQQLLAHLWRLDQELIYAGLVEPNFMRTILTRKT